MKKAKKLSGAKVILKGFNTFAAGKFFFGGYDPEGNTLYLGKGNGHPNGMAAAGGQPIADRTPGISLLETPREVRWANDSFSLRARLSPSQGAAIQTALQVKYRKKKVLQVESLHRE